MLRNINITIIAVFFLISMASMSFSQSMQIDSSGFKFNPNVPCILKLNNGGDPNGDPLLYPNCNNSGSIGVSSNRFWNSWFRNMHSLNIYNESDSTIKENIADLENVFDKIKKIRTVRFDYKTLENESDRIRNDNKNKIGFLAQDIMKSFPELVKKDDENGKYSVNYIEMIPVLLKAVQDLKATVDQQQKTINSLLGK
jgi:hypothetical protein